MKKLSLGITVIALTLFVAAGCAKKEKEISLSDTGFETASTTELAQLPQQGAQTTSNQQAAVEVLPIEMAPVTQAAQAYPQAMTEAISTTSPSLSQNQQIQTALKNAGLYAGKIDGKIGPASKRAIEEFQRQHNLKVDGKVGPKTWVALEQYLTGAPAMSTATGSEE